MKIGELLELTKTEPLDKIAKERLTIGKMKAREAIKAAGCYSKNGVRGWFYDGPPELLERSIYEFVEGGQQKARPKKQNASINDSNLKANKKQNESNIKANTSESKASTRKSIAKASNELDKSEQKTITSEPDAIDRLLMQGDSKNERRTYRGFYFDNDILEVLDNVKRGNKSDLINEALRAVFTAKGLIKKEQD